MIAPQTSSKSTSGFGELLFISAPISAPQSNVARFPITCQMHPSSRTLNPSTGILMQSKIDYRAESQFRTFFLRSFSLPDLSTYHFNLLHVVRCSIYKQVMPCICATRSLFTLRGSCPAKLCVGSWPGSNLDDNAVDDLRASRA